MGIRIELPKDAWEQVCAQADREWRTPKQQAEYLILKALGWELSPTDNPTAKPPANVRAFPARPPEGGAA